jgi:hypothetical protein
MLFKEIICVYSANHPKHINTHREQNCRVFNIKAGGTYSYHYALKLSVKLCI